MLSTIIVENSLVEIEDGTKMKVHRCPICGSRDVYIQQNRDKSQVRCWQDQTCRYRTGWFNSLAEALKEWNTL